jgi:RNA polymerase sigma-70 factor (ECF subfamily)
VGCIELRNWQETFSGSQTPLIEGKFLKGGRLFPPGRHAKEFERVILPHTQGLIRFARRLMPDQAEDLVQQALLLAWRGFDRFRGESSPRTWVFQILVNTVRSEARRFQRLPVIVPLEENDYPLVARSSGDHAEMLWAADRLPDDQKEALLLAAVEGFTCSEIGVILGVPTGTVASRLSRARSSLREQRARVMAMEMKRKA